MNPCVKAILCALSEPVRQAIADLLAAQKALLQAAIALLTAQLAQLEIVLAPVTALRSLAQAAKDGLTGSISLVPSALFQECFDLGTLNLSIGAALDDLTAPVDARIQDADRLLARLDELEAKIASLNETISFYDDIIAVIQSC